MLKLFIRCIQSGDVDQLKLLLKKDRKLATQLNKNRDTMLHIAVQARNIAVIRLLLEYGAQHKANGSGQTPLHLAATYGQIDIMRVLLKEGASVNERDDNGDTPLYIAIDHAGRMIAYHFSDISTCDRFIGAVILLLLNGANTNLANKKGDTPLLAAAWCGNTQLTVFLLQFSAEVNKANKKGESPLFAAAARGHTGVVEILLAHNAKINQTNKQDQTPFDIARVYGHIVVIKLLEETRMFQKNSPSIALHSDFFRIENSPVDSQCPPDSDDDSDCDDLRFSPVSPYPRRHTL